MQTSAVKTNIRSVYHSFAGAVGAAALLLLAVSALAQNLFVSDYSSGSIYEFTPGGGRSTSASELNSPAGLAFNSAGDLFEADRGSGNIYEFTPDGARSTFASGFREPLFIAFAPIPEPSALGLVAVGSLGLSALLVFRRRRE
jgi:DNA-binding beta-propeller fold protein YncE